MLIGAVEDSALQTDAVIAKAKMDLARLAGFNAVRFELIWEPGMTEPAARTLRALRNGAGAAEVDAIRPIVAVRNRGGRTAPVSARARREFAAFMAATARSVPAVRHFIVGNEPNLNTFWMPQYDRKGGNAAARSYGALLGASYDALKRVSRSITVIGGALSPRGQDKYPSIRHTHSPTAFIRDLGKWYRASKRRRPLMDWFALHGYQQRSWMRPTLAHPRSTTITIADYGKLVALLGKAFDKTAQRGSRLPILYGEFGVQSEIPPDKKHLYRNFSAPGSNDAVDEETQADYYRQALQLAYCQRNVVGLLIFHVTDEADLGRWQSGIYYADETPKAAFDTVKRTIEDVRSRSVTCAALRPGHRVVGAPRPKPHGFSGHPLERHVTR